jgi:hypothetical protein
MTTNIGEKVLRNIMGHKNLNLDRTSLNLNKAKIEHNSDGTDKYDDNGEVYARANNLQQMKKLIKNYGYKDFNDFTHSTGIKPKTLVKKFIFVQGEGPGDRVFIKE